MPMDSTKYREYLHQVRSHPPISSPAIKLSSRGLLISLTVFLALELGFEWQWEDYPAGLLFPFGYLVLWALLYSYQGSSKKSSISDSTQTFFYDALQNLREILSLLAFPPPKRKPRFVPPRIPTREHFSPSQLPRDVENALGLLGLKGCRDWKKIQKRYRELAKKFHPDLNPDLTQTGNRFIIYDGAYRKLAAVKDQYFSHPNKP